MNEKNKNLCFNCSDKLCCWKFILGIMVKMIGKVFGYELSVLKVMD